LQLNDSTTAFLGGKDSSQQILTFDWNSLSHKKHIEVLHGKRWNAACALATGPGGEQVSISPMFYEHHPRTKFILAPEHLNF
jgi:hypothetical protein